MELDLTHLERCGVRMPHQIANEATILVHALGTCPIRDSRSLYDRGFAAHVVNDANETIVEDGERLAEDRV